MHRRCPERAAPARPRTHSAGSCRRRRGSAPGCACRTPTASDLAASRSAERQGPLPRGFIFSRRSHDALGIQRLGRPHQLHVAAVAAPMAERDEAHARSRPNLGERAGALPRAPGRPCCPLTPSILPAHGARAIEDDDDGAGSCAREAAGAASVTRSAAHAEVRLQPAAADTEIHMADAAPSYLEQSHAHCTREGVGLARALLGENSDRQDLSAPMSQETLELLLQRRSTKAAMLGDPGPTPPTARDDIDGGRARARPQEARALALHRLRGRRARRLRPGAPEGVPRRGQGDALGRATRDGAHAAPAGTDRGRRHLARDAQSRRARVGADPLLRGRLLQSLPGRQCAGLRHLLDHGVVFLQPSRARRPRGSPPTSGWPASSTSARPRSSSPIASAPSSPRS